MIYATSSATAAYLNKCAEPISINRPVSSCIREVETDWKLSLLNVSTEKENSDGTSRVDIDIFRSTCRNRALRCVFSEQVDYDYEIWTYAWQGREGLRRPHVHHPRRGAASCEEPSTRQPQRPREPRQHCRHQPAPRSALFLFAFRSVLPRRRDLRPFND